VTAHNGNVSLAFEQVGDDGGEPLLLIMGLGMQMIYWPEGLLAQFADAGFTVARFDNRDAGASTHLTWLGAPSLAALLTTPRLVAPYRIADMAADAVAVLDALGWDSAHVLGTSLGGMIAQAVAIEHPERVRSLTSVMATPAPWLGLPTRRGIAALLAPPARNPDEAAERAVATFRVIGSPDYPLDEEWLRAYARRAFARGAAAGADAGSPRRQLAAAMASPSRLPGLRRLQVPTLVVHGEDDPLIRPAAGRAVARAVPGARLLTFRGMGHNLPAELWPAVAAAVRDCAARAWRSGL
jgi:pimeloyl-ACP methyl ester carboxylesterase